MNQQRPSNRESIRPAVRFVAKPYRRALAAMTTIAFLGGTAEALFLVLVTRTAFAITVTTWSATEHRSAIRPPFSLLDRLKWRAHVAVRMRPLRSAGRIRSGRSLT